MKKIEWLTDNKMLFESEHKTFNRQTKLITTGNHIGDTQLSFFIRSFKETKCNDFSFEVGNLQNYDLNGFEDLPYEIREEIKRFLINRSGILNEFRYWIKERKILVGYVLTDTEHNLIKVWNVLNTKKSESILKECIRYITN